MAQENGVFGPPVVARWGGQPLGPGEPEDPSTPLVVLLHGRGSTQDSMVRLAPNLPFGPAYAAVRGPVDEGDGFTWYLERERAQPTAESLAVAMAWFTDWLDTEGDPERPVILVGFSTGSLLAAGLLLARPERWAGGALLRGLVPFDAGVPVTRGRLIGIPVFLDHADDDAVLPAGLRSRTEEYLIGHSGAPVHSHTGPGGHDLSQDSVEALSRWIGERLAFLGAEGENPLPDGEDQHWPTLPGGTLPLVEGPARPGGERVVLPVALAYDAVAKGWAVADPSAGLARPAGAVLVADRPDPGGAVTAAAIVAAAHLR